MKDYKLTIENGTITRIENMDEQGNPISGILHIPKDAIAFDLDAWVFLGCSADGIVVDEENPVFSSAHNCLLSKDGKKLIKACKNSDISKLSCLESIGRDAFDDPIQAHKEFVFRIPDGVTTLEYRAFALSADKVSITVPPSVRKIRALAFMIYSDDTNIVFEGDTELEVGAFGTELEAKASEYEFLKTVPSAIYPKKERITVSCPRESDISAYCQKYAIVEA